MRRMILAACTCNWSSYIEAACKARKPEALRILIGTFLPISKCCTRIRKNEIRAVWRKVKTVPFPS